MISRRHIRSALVIGAAIILLFLSGKAKAAGTLSPAPRIIVTTSSGAPINGACIWTYLAGTSTPTTTWTDKALSVANGNPVIATVGLATIYLQPGISYKYIVENIPCNSGLHGAVLYSQDNIDAVPASASAVDVLGTAGESISAGQVVYLSDGSGAKSAGQWYKADSANAYSSTTPQAGIATAAIASAAIGSIRTAGSITGLASLTVGARYYVGVAGAVTTTATSRFLGQADSTTSLVLSANPPIGAVDNAPEDFRLTFTTGTPVTTADVTGASAVTVFCSPYHGTRIALYDAAGVPTLITSAEFSIAVPGTTSQMYSVWAYSNGGVATLELGAWTNDTTPGASGAVARTTTGALTKSGDLTRRYLGVMRTGTVSGQSEDSVTKRYLWNYYNRVRRSLFVSDATATWTYDTPAFRQVRATATNQISVIVGVAEVATTLTATLTESGNAGLNKTGIGYDSTTTLATGAVLANGSAASGETINLAAFLTHYPAIGFHTYAWLEWSAAATGTFSGGTNGPTGLSGWIEG